MKKKVAVSLIVLCTVLLGTSIIAFANYAGQTVFDVHENGVMCSLKTYDASAVGKVVIPKDYNGLMVTGINENAFLKCKDVTEVVVPKTVVNIGEFSLGYIETKNGEKLKKEDFVIWGRAGSEAEKYAQANGFIFKVYLTTPQLVSAKNTVGGVNITWVPTENAAGYNVYRKVPKGRWQKLGYLNGENTKKYFDSSVENTKDYIYTVKAVHGKTLSGYDKKGVSVHYVEAPKVTLSNVKSGVKITWSKNDKATTYRVYKKAYEAKSWTRIKIVKSNVLSFVDTTAISGEKAYYCVIAVENENLSSYETNKLNLFLSEPVITAVKNSTTGIRVYWNKVNGTQKYRVYRRTNGSSWEVLKDVSANNAAYTDETAKEGVKYIYTVKSFAGKYKSSYSKGLSLYCVSYPTLKSVKPTTNALTVSWNQAPYADYYTVYRKNQSGSWERIYKTPNNKILSYKDTNVSSGNSFTYTVIAWYKNTKSSFDSNGITGTFFSSPVLNSAKCIKAQSIVLDWSRVDGASKYTIYKKEIGENYSILAQVNSDVLSYTDTAISIGKEYAYVIKAVSNSGLVSGSSNTKTVKVLDSDKPMVALTFDDGPSNSATTRILNVLEANNARATFFVVGSRVDSYKSQISRAYSLGCEIGNHTYNHKTLTSLSADEVKKELGDTDKKIKAITGEAPALMRPPGGSYKNDTVRNNTAYPIIMWSVDTRDWESRDAEKIVASIKANVRDGSIILMHDLYDSTATATEIIVPWLISQGYQLVTVSEMMEAKGITMQNGVAYSSAK